MNEQDRTEAEGGGTRRAATARPLLEVMRELVAASPDRPLKPEELPAWEVEDDDSLFAADTMDDLAGHFAAPEAQAVNARAAMDEVRLGLISHWRELDTRFQKIFPMEAIDALLSGDEPFRISPAATRMFWQMAQESAHFEAVKWGIAIGALDGDPAKINDLVIMARHPELSIYACVALRRMMDQTPEATQALIGLLPVSNGWGVVKLVEQFQEEERLAADLHTQRMAAIYGTENRDGIPYEIAFLLASYLDLHRLIDLAETDDRLCRALCDLFSTLFIAPEPLGGIADLDEPIPLLGHLLEMLAKRPADVYVLALLLNLRQEMAESGLDQTQAPTLLHDVNDLWQRRYDDDLLRRGLEEDDRTRWLTAGLICCIPAFHLRRELRALVSATADRASLRALARIGDAGDLEALLAAIPRLVKLEERARRPISATWEFDEDHLATDDYATIVAALGLLATPAAIHEIRRALRDYAPEVREAACQAAANLPGECLDAELAALLRERLDDPVESVSKAAKAVILPGERGTPFS